MNTEQQIAALVRQGKYTEASKLAFEHGEDAVLFAMNQALSDGVREALLIINTHVSVELNRRSRDLV